MTIQGGGGGRNVPPGTPRTTTSEKPSYAGLPSTQSASPPTSTTQGIPPASTKGSTSANRDGFEASRFSDPRLKTERAALPVPHDATSNSGIESTVRLLEGRHDEILDEHRALRDQVAVLLADLSRGGFERTAIGLRRAEVLALRARLAEQRHRLRQIKRRLKAVVERSARVGDIDVSRTLQGHLDKMKRLEPGVQRTLAALAAMEQAMAGLLDGTGPAAVATTGLPVDAGTARDHGTALARVVPAATVAVAIAELLAPSSSPPTTSSPLDVDTDDPTVRGLQAFAEQLLSSL